MLPRFHTAPHTLCLFLLARHGSELKKRVGSAPPVTASRQRESDAFTPRVGVGALRSRSVAHWVETEDLGPLPARPMCFGDFR